jgi:N-carbamoylputrescine amidase
MADERAAGATLRLGLVQMSMTDDRDANVAKAEARVREAAAGGARLVLLPELFEYLYWPQAEREEYFELAHPVDGHPFLGRFQASPRSWAWCCPCRSSSAPARRTSTA